MALTAKGAACRKSERALTRLSVILGIFPVLGFLLYPTTVIVGAVVPFGEWFLGKFLAYILSLFVLNRGFARVFRS
jgi:hypothetical protein